MKITLNINVGKIKQAHGKKEITETDLKVNLQALIEQELYEPENHYEFICDYEQNCDEDE